MHVFFRVLFFLVLTSFSLQAQKALVAVSVANFLKEPVCCPEKLELPLMEKDVPFLKSQLLYGERVYLIEEQGEWAKVQTTEQVVSDDERTWRGLRGWVKRNQLIVVDSFPLYNLVIKASWATVYSDTRSKEKIIDLSVGTLLQSVDIPGSDWCKVRLADGSYGYVAAQHVYPFLYQETPSQLHLSALLGEYLKIFLGDPYCWSGRCAYCPDKCFITGIDCSGLVELAYRMLGFIIPRFAHYQYMKAKPVEPKNLKIGDLVFTKYQHDNWQRVTHVLMYLGNDMLIESTGRPGVEKVRVVSFEKAFGVDRRKANNGKRYNRKQLHCGSFFNTEKDIEEMRLRCVGLDA